MLLKNCVPVTIRLVYRSQSAPNELLWHRYLVGELNKVCKVVYAKPHLPRVQSLSRNNKGFDLVLKGPKYHLIKFLSGLRGVQMAENDIVRSSTVKLGEVTQEDHILALEKVCESAEQQWDISRRQRSYNSQDLPQLVRVVPWIFNAIPLEPQYVSDSEALEHDIDQFYATVSSLCTAEQFVALDTKFYQGLESMPLGMQRWFIGAERNDDHKKISQERLEFLTNGFKSF
ncbi:MSS18 (YPR134W) [Zygosaccharomyces parabailii]|nr:MSS18 (YPR134W) [Zygosaccharomyces parabailii]CDH14289.1 uncharacterized protein ZBAI_06075 [Zygosaccharomyces bailii ISA1307]